MVAIRRRFSKHSRGTAPKQPRRGQRGRRRAALTALGFTLVGVLGFIAVAAAITTTDVPDPLAAAPTISHQGSDAVTITWLGDTFLGDAAQPLIDQHGADWPSALLPPLNPQHVVIANLEGPITDISEPFDPMQRWSYNSQAAAAEALSAMGISAISLANNHAMDRGPAGLQDTFANADAAGMYAFGAGHTSNEARLPLLIDSDKGLVGVLGFSDDGGLVTAKADRPGVRRLSLENLEADIDAARAAGVDRVVAAVHWGGNYTSLDPRQRTWAEAFADAGYDMVIGTGPHVVQPIEVVKGMPVVFSLGNYVFGTPGRFPDHEGYGLVVTTSFTSREEVDVTVRCIQTDNDVVDFQARPCSHDDASAVLSIVNPSLVAAGDSATITLPLGPSSG